MFQKFFKEDVPVKPLFSRLALMTLLACGLIAGSTSAARAQDAAASYKSKCAVCHGADGKGSAMGQKMGTPDFTSDVVQKQTDLQLTLTITKGKAKMPAYDGKLKDTEIKDLVAYLRSFGKK
jgi:cytochrome c6